MSLPPVIKFKTKEAVLINPVHAELSTKAVSTDHSLSLLARVEYIKLQQREMTSKQRAIALGTLSAGWSGARSNENRESCFDQCHDDRQVHR